MENTEILQASISSNENEVDSEVSIINIKDPLNLCCRALLDGRLVAVPTETVYGLAADATNDQAVMQIFKTKGRPQDNPLIVHVSDLEMARRFCCRDQVMPERYLPLIERFWPGPLTILVPQSDGIIAPSVSGGSVDTIGVRVPANEVTRRLIERLGRPLAAPSANLSGKPSPTTAAHVYQDFCGKIPYILQDGDEDRVCRVGVESTVINALCDPPVVLRPGGISLEMIRQVPGFENTVAHIRQSTKNMDDEDFVPTTPGMKYRHYSPQNAQVILFEYPLNLKDYTNVKQMIYTRMNDEYKQLCRSNALPLKLGIIRTIQFDQLPSPSHDEDQFKEPYQIIKYETDVNGNLEPFSSIKDQTVTVYDYVISNGNNDNLEFARHLFHALRYFDETEKVQFILTHGVPEVEIGTALMNRLRKAATKIIE